jgi:hypothetical protein
MKKLLLLVALLLVATVNYSQTVNGYLKQTDFKAHRYHGFRSCYDSIIVDLVLDSTQCYYFGSGAVFQGNAYNNNEIVIKCPQEPLTRYEYDWAAYNMKYSSIEQDIFLPYKNNTNNYLIANSTAIISTLGFTPYNGSTNPNGFMTGSSISMTTTGTSGAATWNSSTKVLNIPQYTFSQVQSDWNAASGTSFIQNKPTIPSNTNQLTNGAGFITGITVGSPSVGNTLTSGTAFQPRSGGPCNINVSSSIGSGLAAVTGTIVIAMSSTQNGTYTTVTTDGVILSLLSSSLDRSSATIPVPTGWWVKVTYTTVGLGASLTGTYTKWDL